MSWILQVLAPRDRNARSGPWPKFRHFGFWPQGSPPKPTGFFDVRNPYPIHTPFAYFKIWQLQGDLQKYNAAYSDPYHYAAVTTVCR